jgi:uncharacterized protein
MIPSTRELYHQVETFWTEQIAALGGQYRAAPLSFFREPLNQACGAPATLAGPFYCPDSETVYLDEGLLQQVADRAAGSENVALGYIVAHELAHHVQNIVGTTDLIEQARSRSNKKLGAQTLLSFELQADCYAGLWLHWEQQRGRIAAPADLSAVLAAVAATGQRQQSQLHPGEQMLDPLTHGTPAQRLKWLHRGLDGGDFNACDTFGAEAAGLL